MPSSRTRPALLLALAVLCAGALWARAAGLRIRFSWEPTGHARPEPPPEPEACTSILVGRLASADGSVFTSHTCDGNYRNWLRVVPAARHEAGAKRPVLKGTMKTEFPDDRRGVEVLGEIPQAPATLGYLDTAYPCMNERQVAMGESTFEGRKELKSDQGLFHVEELQRVALERAASARDAVLLMGALAEEHGYIDVGEALTVADPREAWHMEILGPGKGRKGAVWAAVRIPDDHVGVAANLSRIGRVDLERPEEYLASSNLLALAQEMKWWDPASGKPFRFWEAYGGKKPFTVREYWVFRELAPSLALDFEQAEELPFSVKPERPVTREDLFRLLRATYEGSPFDLTRNLVLPDPKAGAPAKASHVHPWLAKDQMDLFNALQPGSVTFHRPIAVMFNAYHTVLQCRAWLPDAIGGICWLGLDNPAGSPRVPLHAGITGLPPDWETGGQHRFRRDSAAWAFRRAIRLAAFHWGKNRGLLEQELGAWESRIQGELPALESRALQLHQADPAAARALLTGHASALCRALTHRYWELGDQLWLEFRFRL